MEEVTPILCAFNMDQTKIEAITQLVDLTNTSETDTQSWQLHNPYLDSMWLLNQDTEMPDASDNLDTASINGMIDDLTKNVNQMNVDQD
jgi:hypothetical protein